MADKENYQMAIDLLSCHLGLSEEEAKERLGLAEKKSEQATKHIPEPNLSR
ncbi:hypothetical protein [Vibrio rumoiensis]|uniref:hypothetical protein n=1 Tax=Vibrio rumoiensis TaxID=76258 RepID=UPI0002D8C636|nr:hypothetical protein [Vibrio rumoiensis]